MITTSVVCNRCGEEKPIEKFPSLSRGKRGWQQPCKKCSASLNRERRQTNPYHYKALKYKTDPEEVGRLLSKDCCEICGLPAQRKCLDHSHRTGKLRGMLCNECNVGLGKFKDNPVILQEAIRYLEEREYNDE